jgi:hypothetical protein
MYLSRFIPRQVSTKSRIVFHDKADDDSGKHKTQLLKRSSKDMETGDVSLEVHKKIRVVTTLKGLVVRSSSSVHEKLGQNM